MNTLKEKKKQAIQMFLLTVKNDLNQWRKKYSDEYRSDVYNDYYFHVHLLYKRLTLKNEKYSSETILLVYKRGIIPTNWKINRAVNKIKKHFNQIEKDKESQSKIDFINGGLKVFKEKFIKEVRKEKLQEISK